MGNPTSEVGAFGGLLFLLAFIHFVVDWGFQSHKEAMQKSKNSKVRAVHCTVYTMGLLPIIFMINQGLDVITWSVVLLWLSHFLIDTYIPVYLWLKYVRRYPTFDPPEEGVIPLFKRRKGSDSSKGGADLQALQAAATTPLGLLLMITMDQVFHILFLVPIAGALTWPASFHVWATLSGVALMLLLVSTVSGARDLTLR